MNNLTVQNKWHKILHLPQVKIMTFIFAYAYYFLNLLSFGLLISTKIKVWFGKGRDLETSGLHPPLETFLARGHGQRKRFDNIRPLATAF